MSDAILEDGPEHYYYIGRDRFPFAVASSFPIEDDLDSSFQPARESSASLRGIVDSFVDLRRDSVLKTVQMASITSSACRGILLSVESRLRAGNLQGKVAGSTAQDDLHSHGRQQAAGGGYALFPAGSRISEETWTKLAAAAEEQLVRQGYLITQTDKRNISAMTGIEVTPYIWSTLMKRLDLKKVRNPFPSSLVVYVPRLKHK